MITVFLVRFDLSDKSIPSICTIVDEKFLFPYLLYDKSHPRRTSPFSCPSGSEHVHLSVHGCYKMQNSTHHLRVKVVLATHL